MIQLVLSNYKLSKVFQPAAKALKPKPKYRNLFDVIQSLDISQINHCYYKCNKTQEQRKNKLESVSEFFPTHCVKQRGRLHIECKSRFNTE